MTLREYFGIWRDREFAIRGYDCAKFAMGAIALRSPAAARELARLLVKAGYNEVKVGDEQGIKKVYAYFGAKTPLELVYWFHDKFPEHVELPPFPLPGDIAVREEGLSFGVVDEDHEAAFLKKPSGFVKRPLTHEDAFLRIKDGRRE